MFVHLGNAKRHFRCFTLNGYIAIYSIDNQFFVTIFLLNDKLIMMSVTKWRR